MHLGLYTDSVPAMSPPEALDRAARIGATEIEISTGGQSSAPHLSLDRLLSSEQERTRLTDALERRGLHLSALNRSTWLLHPRLRTEHASVVRRTIRLALAALGEAGYDGALSIENEDRSLAPVDSVVASASFVMPLIAERNAARAGPVSDAGRSPVLP